MSCARVHTASKVTASGGVASPADRRNKTPFALEELKAKVEEAAACSTYVCTPASTSSAIARSIKCGMRSIKHGNCLDEAMAEMQQTAWPGCKTGRHRWAPRLQEAPPWLRPWGPAPTNLTCTVRCGPASWAQHGARSCACSAPPRCAGATSPCRYRAPSTPLRTS